MKKMTKIIAVAFTAAALFIGTNVNAQTIGSGLRFGIGVEGLLPTGRLRDISNIGVGITPRLQFGVADNIGLTLTSGYLNFFGKEVENSGINRNSYGMIPVKAGIKAFVSKNIYFSGEVGAAFETSGYAEYEGGPERGTNTKLLASPGIGWANQSWDVGVRYENYSGQSNNFGSVGLRLAYGFGL
jgi:hypothetical protein